MLLTITSLWLALLALQGTPEAQTPADFASVKGRAERLCSEGSWALARDAYAALDPATVPEEERAWLAFRLADTLWRAQRWDNATRQATVEEAARRLRDVVDTLEPADPHPRAWAEAHESLADLAASPMRSSAARESGDEHLLKALEWWAGAPAGDEARRRYLAIVWRLDPTGERAWERSGGRPTRRLAREVVALAATPEEVCKANLLLARTMVREGGPASLWAEIEAAFDRAGTAALSPCTPDAIFEHAAWLERYGRERVDADGQLVRDGDLPRALALYRRLQSEWKPNDTRHGYEVAGRVRELTETGAWVKVATSFLPGSPAKAELSWRSVDRVELALYRLDLHADVDLDGVKAEGSWLDRLDVSRREPLRRWTRPTGDAGDLVRGTADLPLELPPGPGCYLLVARGAASESRALAQVTDLVLATRRDGDHTLVWATTAPGGAPAPGVELRVWEARREGPAVWRARPAVTTDAEGLARVPLGGESTLLLAGAGERQAWAGAWGGATATATGWLAYSWTDRPVYRPGEQVNLSVTVRHQDDPDAAAPRELAVTFRVQSGNWKLIAEGNLALDELGVGDASFTLPDDAQLGTCSLRLDAGDRKPVTIQEGPLFRIEEYRLPEFEVKVAARSTRTAATGVLAGDPVEVTVAASYYHGGPVFGAEVELLAYRLASSTPPDRGAGRGQPWVWQPGVTAAAMPWSIDHRERLVTDVRGLAHTVLDTSWVGEGTCGVTALVTDLSRREAAGSTRILVAREAVRVQASTAAAVTAPGAPVRVTVRALAPDDGPASWRGEARVAREVWTEVWVDPSGREVRGDELRELKASYGHPAAVAEGWRLRDPQPSIFEELLRLPVEVPASGTADIEVVPPRPGKYTITLAERGARLQPYSPYARTAPTGSVTVWVADATTHDLECYSNDVSVVLARDTASPGEELTGLVLVPLPDRYVLLTVDTGAAEEVRVLRVAGTAATFTVPVTAAQVPNALVQAHAVLPRRFASGRAELLVPPLDRFLDVTLEPERPGYEPGDVVTLCLRALDRHGTPVAGQFAVSVFDAATLAIQPELAGDIRAYFFGRLRQGVPPLQASSGLPVRLEDVDGRLVDEYAAGRERDAARRRAEERRRAGSAPARPEPPPVPGMGEGVLAAMSVIGSVILPPVPAVKPRSNFAATALWSPRVRTDAAGEALVTLALPESTTRWRAVARGVGDDGLVGAAAGELTAAKPVQARIQAPRFLVAGDVATTAVVVDNATGGQLAVTATLSAEGATVADNRREVQVGPGASERADFEVRTTQAGTLRVVAGASAGELVDAMQRDVPVVAHGTEKVVSRSGELAGPAVTASFVLPAMDTSSATATIQVATSPAAVLLDALPFLLEAPGGCTETTVSRFLPAVVVARALERLGVARDRLEARLAAGRAPGVAGLAPAADLADLDRIVAEGRLHLRELQHDDGGWGWCEGHASDPLMTAYVLWSLGLLGEPHGDDEDLAWRGERYLAQTLGPALGADVEAFGLLALAAIQPGLSDRDAEAALGGRFDGLFERRAELRPAGLAHLALVANRLGRAEAVAVLTRNLANGAVAATIGGASTVDPAAGAGDPALAVVHWESPGPTGATFDGAVEATAFVAMALRAVDPGGPLLPAAERWLAHNRRGVAWSNTRDTALAILALTGAIVAATPPLGCGFEARLNGTVVASLEPPRCEAVELPVRRTIDPALLRVGTNELRIRRTAPRAPLWYSLETRFFTREDPIAPASSRVALRRQYLRLSPRPTLLRGPLYEKTELAPGAPVTTGDRIEVVLTVEAPTDLAYVVIRDPRPAGWEAMDLHSGADVVAHRLTRDAAVRRFDPGPAVRPTQGSRPGQGPPASSTGDERTAYRELGAREVELYLDRLPQGIWEVRYLLRAETPGRFHGLPARVQAAYAPELAASSAELHVTVAEPAP